ncbi:hypothetical protein HMPREF3038_02563 [Akkermansia sp. KLE1797]|nr:hypothetical protein HMPREF3038_02563 [Akkermansia sp. KLE1797]KXU52906.1 hypothetical protein HMPREF3039_02921 [Akkermansia sp. KLE1798]KZA04493.1 hypothetical protein HMPREF1326_01841 [Akkermansia sp. KLE1605]
MQKQPPPGGFFVPGCRVPACSVWNAPAAAAPDFMGKERYRAVPAFLCGNTVSCRFFPAGGGPCLISGVPSGMMPA